MNAAETSADHIGPVVTATGLRLVEPNGVRRDYQTSSQLRMN